MRPIFRLWLPAGGPENPTPRARAGRAGVCGLAIALALGCGGCTQVPAWKQERVSRPGLLFSDSAVLASRSNLIGQIEPGSAVAGGAQAAGCTACR
jgi:hypothetical protein